MNNEMNKHINNKGQVTIFVIIAIVVVAGEIGRAHV